MTKKPTFGPKPIALPNTAKYGAGQRKTGAHQRNNGTVPGRVGKRVAAAPHPRKTKPVFKSPTAGDRNSRRPLGRYQKPGPRKMPAGRMVHARILKTQPVPPPTQVVYEQGTQVPVILNNGSTTEGTLLAASKSGAGKGSIGQYSVRLPGGKVVLAHRGPNGFRVAHDRVK